ncbi:hypothetical protein [Glaesserella parasuis]|uniref:hypothetical protein n=1 Tax=Glaesserella parasuis TaxID=738 RepID=UPI003B673986
MNRLFRLLLAISSTSLLPVIYLIKSEVYIFQSGIYSYIESDLLKEFLIKGSLLGYLVFPIGLSLLAIHLVSRLGKDKIEKGEVLEVQDASSNFLPSYLGYFFVALSVTDKHYFTLCFIWGILIIFVFLSQINYYNPIFLLFKYKFYNIKTKNGLSLFLISKDEFKKGIDVSISKIYRINNFTFIHKE